MGLDVSTIPGHVQVPLWVLIGALLGLCSAIAYLVRWVRTLVNERSEQSARDVEQRDLLLERVLKAVTVLGETVTFIRERK